MKTLFETLIVTAIATLGLTAPVQARDRHERDWVQHIVTRPAVVHVAPARAAHHHRNDRFARYLDRRHNRQDLRIERGWKNGELTPRELRRLRRSQGKLERLERRFGADGHYSKKERRVLNEVLDRNSDRIYRKKHNDRQRVLNRHRSVRAFDRGAYNGIGIVWHDRY